MTAMAMTPMTAAGGGDDGGADGGDDGGVGGDVDGDDGGGDGGGGDGSGDGDAGIGQLPQERQIIQPATRQPACNQERK